MPTKAYTSITGKIHTTAQTLVQHVAYTLSDTIFTFSSELFDLDLAVQQWVREGEFNAHAVVPRVQSMETRPGAGTIALGYVLSDDYKSDTRKKGVSQSLLASTATLDYLAPVLGRLSYQLNASDSPFVVHVSAIDYVAGGDAEICVDQQQLVPDYHPALRLARDLGIALIVSACTRESQHIALLATLLASLLPVIHIYDGVRMGPSLGCVSNAIGHVQLASTVRDIGDRLRDHRRLVETDTVEEYVSTLFETFNSTFHTTYRPFEYHGHDKPESVIIVFGSFEANAFRAAVDALSARGNAIGLVVVRLYRPFMETAFLAALPSSAQEIVVLVQPSTKNEACSSAQRHSPLYEEVLAILTFVKPSECRPSCVEYNLPAPHLLTRTAIFSTLQLLFPHMRISIEPAIAKIDTKLFTFWDMDDGPSQGSVASFVQGLCEDPSANVSSVKTFNSTSLGGILRTDVAQSQQPVDLICPIETADFVFIGDLRILTMVDVLEGAKVGATVIIYSPGTRQRAGWEANLPVLFKNKICQRQILLLLLDTASIDDSVISTAVVKAAFVRAAYPELDVTAAGKVFGVADVFNTAFQNLSSYLETVDPGFFTVADEKACDPLPSLIMSTSFRPLDKDDGTNQQRLKTWHAAAMSLAFKEAYNTEQALRPDVSARTFTVHVSETRRLTPEYYDRNIFHIEFDLGDSGLTYEIGEALGIHGENPESDIENFLDFYGLDGNAIVETPTERDATLLEQRTVYHVLRHSLDLFGRPSKRFYESLATFASDERERAQLQTLGSAEGAAEFRHRAEVDMLTYADILHEFTSAHPSLHELQRLVGPLKRREYSIASCQKVTPHSVSLMVVVVGWTDGRGRERQGQASSFLGKLRPGTPVTVSVKPSVMKLPPKATQPIIMAGLGTGLAPFRAFVQHRAQQKAHGEEIGAVLLYMGSRHQREEYCYGEEWEAYQAAGVITVLGRAFSRDQPHKIYIQDRMRETMEEIRKAYLREEGVFYLCGPTWPVPDVTKVLEEAISMEAAEINRRKVDSRREIEILKENKRYVLEVY